MQPSNGPAQARKTGLYRPKKGHGVMRSTCAWTTALLIVTIGVAASEETCVILNVESVDADGFVSCDLTPSELETALGALPASTASVTAVLEHETGQVLSPSQYDVIDADTHRITLRLPKETKHGRVRVSWRQRGSDAPAAGQLLSVRQEGNAVVVSNGHAEVVHDPGRQGGLPSRVTVLKTGAVLDDFTLNDRVHAKEVGGFFLRNDDEASVRVVREGPLEAVIEVRGRYVQAGRTAESSPRAVYEFAYRADCPAIRVTARCTQETAFLWAVELVSADGGVSPEEKTFLNDLMDKFSIDQNTVKKIVEVATIRYRTQ